MMTTQLTLTPYAINADAPVDVAAWAVHRQALRDLPATIDIADPVLPDPPGGE